MKTYSKKFHKGFTLVEVMVATAIFSIIITVGIGALVNVTDTYRFSRQTKLVNDNLNFLMEGMSREIRLGQNYYSDPNIMDGSTEGSANNGNASSIGFTAVENRGYFIYYLQDQTVYRRRVIDDVVYEEVLTNPTQISVKELEFNVVGANEGGVDTRQAFVWIFIRGVIPDTEESISVQTLSSQRRLDVS